MQIAKQGEKRQEIIQMKENRKVIVEIEDECKGRIELIDRNAILNTGKKFVQNFLSFIKNKVSSYRHILLFIVTLRCCSESGQPCRFLWLLPHLSLSS